MINIKKEDAFSLIGSVALGILGSIAVNRANLINEKQFSDNCRAEYIQTRVINRNKNQLPTVLETVDGCNIRVSFSSQAKRDYYSFELEERGVLSIKARRSGDYVTVYSVYKDDPANLVAMRIPIDKYMLHQNRVGNRCFEYSMQTLCFQSEKLFNGFMNIREPVIGIFHIDTAGNIHKIENNK